jgi:hypothetical protein
VHKGLARDTILEGRDDLGVHCVREISAALGEATNVVAKTLDLLLPAMAKLTSIAGPV